ncbi:MAG: prenyltransferase/squalene oxidase repeat-containing protein [Planctomycetota bacterium]|jgi:hypothetical protein
MRRARAFIRGTIALVMLGSVMSILEPPAEGETLAVQVNRAIEKGVEKVRAWQKEDGSFASSYAASYPIGATALGLYTLVKSHAPPDDPHVAKALRYLEYKRFKTTYGTAVLAMALDALMDPAHDAWIRNCGKWLDGKFDFTVGLWSYPGHSHDLSNTQFGVLGLWVAERHGYRARTAVWARLLEAVPDHQHADGGFSYWRSSTQSGSMTTAGLTILALALERVPKDDPRYRSVRKRAKRALEKGWEYLDRRFTIEANPAGSHHFVHDFLFYYLFGVERVAAITGRDRIGGRDWYAEGARRLVATQGADGSWWNGHFACTCFALLFLRKATFTTMGGEVGPPEGEGVPTEPEPTIAIPRPETPFVKRWLLLGPFSNADDSFLSRPVIPEVEATPRASATSAGSSWRSCRSLRDEIDLVRLAGAGDNSGTYAVTYLHVTMDVDTVLWLGHDDGAKAWLDGRLIHDHHFHQRLGPNTFRFPVRLARGVHRLLLKVENVGGPTSFWVRFARPDGTRAREILPSLSPEDREVAECALAQPALFDLPQLFARLPLDRRVGLDFEKEEDLDRVALSGLYPGWPQWFSEVEEGDTGRIPSPGATGVVALHPVTQATPARLIHKVRLPEYSRWLNVRASALPRSPRNLGDAVVRLFVYDGDLHRIAEEVVGPHPEAKPENWKVIRGHLGDFAGEEVLLIVEAAGGGKHAWWTEDVFIDEVRITSR